jgi:hypothetical protein
VEMIQRMNAQLARAAARLDVTVDRGHRASSPLIRRQARAKRLCQPSDSIHHKIFLSM